VTDRPEPAGGGAVAGVSAMPPVEDSAEDLYENAPCGYLSTRPDGTIVKVNHTFLAWTGLTGEELVERRRFQDLLDAGGRIYHETHYAPLLRMQDAVREIALEIVCADGRRLPVLVNATLRRDEEGRPSLIRTTVFNATDRRRYERELLRARERERAVRERVERLQRITARLAATLAPEAIAATAIDELSASGVADRVAIALADPGSDALETLDASGFDPEEVARWDAASASVARALATGEPTFAAADGAVPRDDVHVAIPLIVSGRPIGMLGLDRPGDDPLPDEERAFLTAFAGQCAGALERARLHAETARAADGWATLAEVSRALDEVHGLVARAQRLVGFAVPHLADWAAVELAGDEARTVSAGVAPDWDAHAGREREGRHVELPLRAGRAQLGTLSLARAAERPPFRARDLPFLADLADRAGLAFEIAMLLEQSRGIAHTLQASLLAGEPPRDPRVSVATRYRSADEALAVGGDWYDAFAISGDRAGIAVGDVVGRGIDAATAMGQLRSAIRALALADISPAAVLERLDTFVEHVATARFATVAYGEIDLAEGVMRYACAGHPPPLVLEPGEEPRVIWGGRSAPLGAYAGAVTRDEGELSLAPGARLLLYSDGLVERRGEAIDEGIARLGREFARNRSAPLHELVERVSEAMLAGETSRDDVCLLSVELHRGPSPAARPHRAS
jgi:serine/threonine-protein kinase RsbW